MEFKCGGYYHASSACGKNMQKPWHVLTLWSSLCLRSSANHPSEEIKPCDAFSRKSISKLRLKPGRPGVSRRWLWGLRNLVGISGQCSPILEDSPGVLEQAQTTNPWPNSKANEVKKPKAGKGGTNGNNHVDSRCWHMSCATSLRRGFAGNTPSSIGISWVMGSRFTYSMPLGASHHFASYLEPGIWMLVLWQQFDTPTISTNEWVCHPLRGWALLCVGSIRIGT